MPRIICLLYFFNPLDSLWIQKIAHIQIRYGQMCNIELWTCLWKSFIRYTMTETIQKIEYDNKLQQHVSHKFY